MEIAAIYLGGFFTALIASYAVFIAALFLAYKLTGGKMEFRRWYKEMHF